MDEYLSADIIDDEIVVDSLSSDLEEMQPLGDLMQIMTMKNKSGDVTSTQDSNKTCIDSRELVAACTSCTTAHQVGSDDDTCLSSNAESPFLVQSHTSLFPSLKNTGASNSSFSVEKSVLSVEKESASTKEDSTFNTSNDTTATTNNVINALDDDFPKLLSRKKRRRKSQLSSQRFPSQSYLPSSQSTTKSVKRQPSYFKTHCINMEEINLVESKLSSVEKLLSTKMQRYVEQANIMMKKEVIERIKTIKQSDPHNNVSFSDLDSEDEEEVHRLFELKQSRLTKVVEHQETLMRRLHEQLNKCSEEETENDDVLDSSQSIIPTSMRQKKLRRKTFPSYKLRSYGPKKSANLSEIIHAPNLKSNDSIIFVPVISNEKTAARRPQHSKTKTLKTIKTVLQSPNLLYFKKVVVTPKIKTDKENRPGGVTKLLESQPSLFQGTSHSPQDHILHVSSPGSDIQNPSLAVAHPQRITVPQCNPIQNVPASVSLAPICKIPSVCSQSRLQINQLETTVISSVQLQSSSLPLLPIDISPIQSQPKVQINKSHANVIPLVKSRSILNKNTQVSNQSLPDLCDMLKLGLISRGEVVLSYHCEKAHYSASVVGNGLILAQDYQIYVSPMTWVKAVSNKTTSKAAAYKKVFYHGVSLFDLSTKSGISSVNQFSSASTLSSQPNVGISTAAPSVPVSGKFLSAVKMAEICRSKIRIVKDNEFFLPSSLFSHNLPTSEMVLNCLLNS